MPHAAIVLVVVVMAICARLEQFINIVDMEKSLFVILSLDECLYMLMSSASKLILFSMHR